MKLAYIPLIGLVVILYSVIALGGGAFFKDWKVPNTVPVPVVLTTPAPPTSKTVTMDLGKPAPPVQPQATLTCPSEPRGMEAFLNGKLFSIPMVSKDHWTITWHDVFLLIGLIALFQETLRSTGTGDVTVVNHILSMAVFVICIIEFLIVRGFATSTFFLLMVMALIDVIAGFVISLKSARRDIGVSGGGLFGGGGG